MCPSGVAPMSALPISQAVSTSTRIQLESTEYPDKVKQRRMRLLLDRVQQQQQLSKRALIHDPLAPVTVQSAPTRLHRPLPDEAVGYTAKTRH